MAEEKSTERTFREARREAREARHAALTEDIEKHYEECRLARKRILADPECGPDLENAEVIEDYFAQRLGHAPLLEQHVSATWEHLEDGSRRVVLQTARCEIHIVAVRKKTTEK